MPDLLARLAERTLGLVPMARPALPPLFAPGPAVVDNFTPAERTATRMVADPRREPPTPASVDRGLPQIAAAAKSQIAPAAKKPADLRLRGQEAGPTTGPTRQIAADAGPELELVAQQRTRQPSVETSLDAADTTVRATTTPITGMTGEDAGHPAPTVDTATEFVTERQPRRGVETALDVADTGVRATPLPAAVPPPQIRSHSARKQQREPDGDHGPPESVIEVHIGRIEVRAVFPEAQPMAPARRAADSALSLADYLKERDRGLR